jgi:hypothetical protein
VARRKICYRSSILGYFARLSLLIKKVNLLVSLIVVVVLTVLFNDTLLYLAAENITMAPNLANYLTLITYAFLLTPNAPSFLRPLNKFATVDSRSAGITQRHLQLFFSVTHCRTLSRGYH